MASAIATSSQSRRSRKTKHSKLLEAPPSELEDVEALQQSCDQKVEKLLERKNTSSAYNRYLDQGREYIKNIVAGERARMAGDGTILPRGLPKHMDQLKTEADFAELENSLDGSPNKFSALAIEMFMTQKCLVKGCGKSTAKGLFIARSVDFGTHCKPFMILIGTWNTHIQCYRDGLKYSEARCPARAPKVTKILKAIQIQEKEQKDHTGLNRAHAEAIAIEELTTLIQWSEKTCPNNGVEDLLKREHKTMATVEELKFTWAHALFRAFTSVSWTLWTRSAVL